ELPRRHHGQRLPTGPRSGGPRVRAAARPGRAGARGLPAGARRVPVHRPPADPGGQAGRDGSQGRVPHRPVPQHHALQRGDRRHVRPRRRAQDLAVRVRRPDREAVRQGRGRLRGAGAAQPLRRRV
ncbi:MAG: Uncharacterized protein YjqA, partial [uncultured Pseudonocardia sp.]